jgi:hypothetical protein
MDTMPVTCPSLTKGMCRIPASSMRCATGVKSSSAVHTWISHDVYSPAVAVLVSPPAPTTSRGDYADQSSILTNR